MIQGLAILLVWLAAMLGLAGAGYVWRRFRQMRELKQRMAMTRNLAWSRADLMRPNYRRNALDAIEAERRFMERD